MALIQEESSTAIAASLPSQSVRYVKGKPTYARETLNQDSSMNLDEALLVSKEKYKELFNFEGLMIKAKPLVPYVKLENNKMHVLFDILSGKREFLKSKKNSKI